jgi:MFS transporter, PAT family, beta-lactamase induction signal transducer AmpG
MDAAATPPARTAILRDPMLLRMLAFGFFSGLPLPLTIFTLQQWFTLSGISIHTVSFAAWLGLPYTVKFLWSPLFDRAPPPWAAWLGRRRFWLLAVQPLLALSCVGLALTDPSQNALLTAAAAAAIAFCSASQDILIDAWRIETFPQAEQGVALAAFVWGYRVAMLISGGWAIAQSAIWGWHVTLLVIAGTMALAPVLTLTTPEPVVRAAEPHRPGWLAVIRDSFLAPLAEFLRRPRAAEILGLVILFRLGKVFADNVAASYYHVALGLSSVAVGHANQFPSLFGSLAGAAFGGWLVIRLGTMRALLLTGVVQAASLGLYLVLLAYPTPLMLTVKVFCEFFAGAAADAAFLTFISALCAREYTATQYALLSSLAAIALHLFSGEAGYTAEALGWRHFYVATMLAGIPALLLAHLLRRHFSTQPGISLEKATVR